MAAEPLHVFEVIQVRPDSRSNVEIRSRTERGRGNSAADATHGAGGRDEIGFADVMASFFLPDYGFEPIGKFVIGRTVA